MSQQKIGLLALRFGMAGVYLYFGLSQLAEPADWISLVPDWATSISTLSPITIVLGNAIFEIVFASLLVLGFWLRPVSFILAAHMAMITVIVGFTPIGARNFGLTMATLAHGLLESNKGEKV